MLKSWDTYFNKLCIVWASRKLIVMKNSELVTVLSQEKYTCTTRICDVCETRHEYKKKYDAHHGRGTGDTHSRCRLRSGGLLAIGSVVSIENASKLIVFLY